MPENERAVIVSGGTGALGRAVVAAFVAGGDRVLVPWIVKAEREEVSRLWAQELAASRVSLIEADVAEEEGARRVAEASPAAEVLVNGVGGFAGGTTLELTPLGIWQEMFRINVLTAVALSRAVLPRMLERGSGTVINVASRAAEEAPPGLAAYSSSKAAVAVLTRTLQKEVEAAGLRVHAVVPTTIDTPANRAAMPDADPAGWSAPAEIARVIHWLTTPAAATVRGGLIPV